MRRRWVRVLVLIVTFSVTGVAVWLAFTAEQARSRARVADRQLDATAADAVYALADLRAALHAYVAPGQGLAFWSKHTEEQFARVSTALSSLDEAAVGARYPLSPARESLRRLTAAEARARKYVADGQLLLAADVVFAEAGGLIDAAATDVSGLRQALARAASTREAGATNAQSLLAGGVLSMWILAVILLVPVGTAPVTIVKSDPPPLDLPLAPEDRSPAATPPADLSLLASLCVDMGKVTDARDLDPLLARAAALMGARGLMVWLAEPGGGCLALVAACGYDAELVARLGVIPRDADNLTAAAFRADAPATGGATSTRPAAVAVPLPTAGGPGGVLAAELQTGRSDELVQVTAIAGVVAAQLASLFPMPTATPVEAPRSSSAQA